MVIVVYLDFGGLLFWFDIGLDDCLWLVGGLCWGLNLEILGFDVCYFGWVVMVPLVAIGLVQRLRCFGAIVWCVSCVWVRFGYCVCGSLCLDCIYFVLGVCSVCLLVVVVAY